MANVPTPNPGDIAPVVTPVDTDAVRITATLAEAKAIIAAAETTATAEKLGIDQASYDKYVNKDGEMDWASYGKEVAFKATQAKTAEPVAPVVAPVTPDAEAAAAAAAAATAANAQDVVEKAGLNWDEVTKSVVETGALSAEDKAKLMALNIPEVVIDDYVGAVQREAGAHIDVVLAGFGGEENFNKVFEAVQANATDAQRDQIDALLRDPKTFDVGVNLANKLAVMEPVAPLQGKPVAGAQNQVAATADAANKPYESVKAQLAAQSDPKYNTDPEYRAGVIKRIMASPDLNPRAHSGGM